MLFFASIATAQPDIRCVEGRSQFGIKSKKVLIQAKKLSLNFSNFIVAGEPKKPACKPWPYSGDGGKECAYQCEFVNGDGDEVHVYLTDWLDKEAITIQNIEVMKLEYVSPN